MLAKRKELSNENPGFPNLDLISEWSEKYGLDEEWLRRTFAVFMLGEEHHQPPVEPAGFLKFLPVLKSVTMESLTHTITYIKQYRNASVVYLETEAVISEPFVRLGHARFELFITPQYHCRQDGGSGSGKGMQHSFVVTPPLPDDISELEFQLKIKPFPENPKFREILFQEMDVTIK